MGPYFWRIFVLSKFREGVGSGRKVALWWEKMYDSTHEMARRVKWVTLLHDTCCKMYEDYIGIFDYIIRSMSCGCGCGGVCVWGG